MRGAGARGGAGALGGARAPLGVTRGASTANIWTTGQTVGWVGTDTGVEVDKEHKSVVEQDINCLIQALKKIKDKIGFILFQILKKATTKAQPILIVEHSS